MILKKLIEQANAAVDNAKFQAENIYYSATNTVEGAVDQTSAALTKTYVKVTSTVAAMRAAGLVVAFITAPVPTIVGLGILWLMEDAIKSVNAEIDNDVKKRERKREFDHVVNMLKKHGKIPKTALVETRYVKMSIDSESGEISGTILVGDFKNVPLNEIDDIDLEHLAEAAKDADTKSILNAYISYRRQAGKR